MHVSKQFIEYNTNFHFLGKKEEREKKKREKRKFVIQFCYDDVCTDDNNNALSRH